MLHSHHTQSNGRRFVSFEQRVRFCEKTLLTIFRVSREDFGLDADLPPFSPVNEEIEARFREQFRELYDTPVTGIAPVDEDLAVNDAGVRPVDTVDDDEVADYEFRLFSGPSSKKAEISDGVMQRVAIRSPTPTSGEPGFVVPRRPDTYYFTGSLDSIKAGRIAAAAVSGEDIIQGLSLKWVRVIVL